MARKRVRMSQSGVTLTEVVLFGGEPRMRVGMSYVVSTARSPEGRAFETLAAAKKYFAVQVSLRPRTPAKI